MLKYADLWMFLLGLFQTFPFVLKNIRLSDFDCKWHIHIPLNRKLIANNSWFSFVSWFFVLLIRVDVISCMRFSANWNPTWINHIRFFSCWYSFLDMHENHDNIILDQHWFKSLCYLAMTRKYHEKILSWRKKEPTVALEKIAGA